MGFDFKIGANIQSAESQLKQLNQHINSVNRTLKKTKDIASKSRLINPKELETLRSVRSIFKQLGGDLSKLGGMSASQLGKVINDLKQVQSVLKKAGFKEIPGYILDAQKEATRLLNVQQANASVGARLLNLNRGLAVSSQIVVKAEQQALDLQQKITSAKLATVSAEAKVTSETSKQTRLQRAQEVYQKRRTNSILRRYNLEKLSTSMLILQRRQTELRLNKIKDVTAELQSQRSTLVALLGHTRSLWRAGELTVNQYQRIRRQLTGMELSLQRIQRLQTHGIFDQLEDSFRPVQRNFVRFRQLFLTASASAFAILLPLRSIIKEATEAEKGLNSLAREARVNNISGDRAIETVRNLDLVRNGILSVSSAARSVKLALRIGMNFDEAIKAVRNMTEIALENKQSALTVNEAVVHAFEGFKQELSTLADAAGVTKNISVIYKEFAQSIGKTEKALTRREKSLAISHELQAEATRSAGSLDDSYKTLSGSIDRTRGSFQIFEQMLGTALTPTLRAVFDSMTRIITKVTEWINVNKELVEVLGFAIIALGTLLTIATAIGALILLGAAVAGLVGALGGFGGALAVAGPLLFSFFKNLAIGLGVTYGLGEAIVFLGKKFRETTKPAQNLAGDISDLRKRVQDSNSEYNSLSTGLKNMQKVLKDNSDELKNNEKVQKLVKNRMIEIIDSMNLEASKRRLLISLTDDQTHAYGKLLNMTGKLIKRNQDLSDSELKNIELQARARLASLSKTGLSQDEINNMRLLIDPSNKRASDNIASVKNIIEKEFYRETEDIREMPGLGSDLASHFTLDDKGNVKAKSSFIDGSLGQRLLDSLDTKRRKRFETAMKTLLSVRRGGWFGSEELKLFQDMEKWNKEQFSEFGKKAMEVASGEADPTTINEMRTVLSAHEMNDEQFNMLLGGVMEATDSTVKRFDNLKKEIDDVYKMRTERLVTKSYDQKKNAFVEALNAFKKNETLKISDEKVLMKEISDLVKVGKDSLEISDKQIDKDERDKAKARQEIIDRVFDRAKKGDITKLSQGDFNLIKGETQIIELIEIITNQAVSNAEAQNKLSDVTASLIRADNAKKTKSNIGLLEKARIDLQAGLERLAGLVLGDPSDNSEIQNKLDAYLSDTEGRKKKGKINDTNIIDLFNSMLEVNNRITSITDTATRELESQISEQIASVDKLKGLGKAGQKKSDELMLKLLEMVEPSAKAKSVFDKFKEAIKNRTVLNLSTLNPDDILALSSNENEIIGRVINYMKDRGKILDKLSGVTSAIDQSKLARSILNLEEIKKARVSLTEKLRELLKPGTEIPTSEGGLTGLKEGIQGAIKQAGDIKQAVSLVNELMANMKSSRSLEIIPEALRDIKIQMRDMEKLSGDEKLEKVKDIISQLGQLANDKRVVQLKDQLIALRISLEAYSGSTDKFEEAIKASLLRHRRTFVGDDVNQIKESLKIVQNIFEEHNQKINESDVYANEKRIELRKKYNEQMQKLSDDLQAYRQRVNEETNNVVKDGFKEVFTTSLKDFKDFSDAMYSMASKLVDRLNELVVERALERDFFQNIIGGISGRITNISGGTNSSSSRVINQNPQPILQGSSSVAPSLQRVENTYNINAIDSKSFSQFLQTKQNRQAIASLVFREDKLNTGNER